MLVGDGALGQPALDKLHRIVDVTVEFFVDRPDFRRLLRHIRAGATIIGPVLGEFDGAGHQFDDVMSVLAAVVRDGQNAGEVRDGDERALAHLFSVLINEFVLLTSSAHDSAGLLTIEQFHGLIDGAFRASP